MCKVIASTVILVMLWASPASAQDVTVSKTVHIPGLGGGALVTEDPTHAMVGFGGRFTSIQQLCFHVVMEGDLLDPGEVFGLDWDKLGGRGVWPWDPAIGEFTFCPHPSNYDYWLDGHERIAPVVSRDGGGGSAFVVEFTATITGIR